MKRDEILRITEDSREEEIRFLQELLRIPSPTGSEYEISQKIKETFQENGFEVEEYFADENRPNLRIQWKGEEGPSIMFNSHMDVFPPTEKALNQWSGDYVNGQLYGRGAADMKAGLAAAMMAMILLKRRGYVPKGTVIMTCVCDEENGGKLGTHWMIEHGLMEADRGISTEASEDHLITDSDGVVSLHIEYTSDSWHAGARTGRMDAIQKAHFAVSELYRYDAMLAKERFFYDSNTGGILSVTGIRAGEGDATNMHPSRCSISIDRRYTVGETAESAVKDIENILNRLKEQNEDMSYKLIVDSVGDRLIMDTDDPIVAASINAYRDVFHREITPGRRCGGGDTATIAKRCHYAIPQLGPGRFDQLCVDDEHVDAEEYLGFIAVYMDIIDRILQ